MSAPDYEVVIVGGGLAGLAAAYTLAKGGARVLVVERGERPGAKNVFGGLLHSQVWQEHLPELLPALPIERTIERHQYYLTSHSGLVGLEVGPAENGDSPPLAYTVIRSRLDRLLAYKARQVGAHLLCSCLAQEIVYDQGRLQGVRLDRAEGVVSARAVVLAEGASGLLAPALGLGMPPEPQGFSLAVKETLRLPEQAIDQRFSCPGGAGVAMQFMGSCLQNLIGGGFLYTNRDTLSVGIVVPLPQLEAAGLPPARLLARFKESLPIRHLIVGALSIEYSAHLIPQPRTKQRITLAGQGVLVVGDAAGLVVNTGFKIRGADLAVASGLAAARALLAARQKNDYSPAALAAYPANLERLQVTANLRRLTRLAALLDNPRLYSQYPRLLCRVLQQLSSVGPGVEPRLKTLLHQEVTRGSGWLRTVGDGLKWLTRL